MAESSEPPIPVVPRSQTSMSTAEEERWKAMLDKILAKMDEQGRKMDDMISSLATTTSRLHGAAADLTPSAPSTTVGLATVSSWAVAAQPTVNTFDTDVNFAMPTKCSMSCSDHDDGKLMATTTRASTLAMPTATSPAVVCSLMTSVVMYPSHIEAAPHVTNLIAVKPRCLGINSFGRSICKASTRRQARGGRSFHKASTSRQVRRPLSTVRVQQLAARQVFEEIPREAEELPAWEEGYYTTTRQWQTVILGSDHVVFVELPQDSRPRERLSQEHLKAWLQPAAATSSATMGAKPCTAPMSRWCMHGSGWLVWSCGAHAVAASDIKSTLKLGSDQDIRHINDNRTQTPDWEISGIQLTFDEMPPWQRNDFSPGIFGVEKARSVRVVMPSCRLSGFSPESQVTGHPSVLKFRVLNKAKMVVAMNIMVSNSGAATIASFPILQVVWLLLPWPPPGRSEFAHGLMSIICLQLSRPWDSSAPSNGLKKHSARLLFNKIEYSAAKQWDPGIVRFILMGMKLELGINQSLVQYVQKSLELIQHTASYVIWKQLLAHWLWTCGLWSSASQDSTFMLSNMDQKGSSYRMMEWVSVEVLVADRSMGIALEFFLCFIGREYSVTHRSIPPNAPLACALPENFPKSHGPIVGIPKGFAGLSGAILTQIYAMIHSPYHAPMIFMVVVGPTKVVIALMFIIRPAGGHRQIHPSDGTGFTFVYSVGLLLDVYLLGVMILENLVDWSHTVMVLFTIILIVLLLFPIAIPTILSFFSDDGESVYALLSPSPRTEEASAPFEEQNEVILSEVEDEKPKEVDLFPALEQQKRIVELQAKLF